MAKRKVASLEHQAWTLDQLAKSEFFHQKLHEWGMLEVARQIEQVRGETLKWDRLDISSRAWDKIIHSGIKPVLVFAHPHILMTVPRAVSYYRMIAMVSQKSMNRVGLSVDKYEHQDIMPDKKISRMIARHLNKIISPLIETDEQIDAREFDLWRGMAAGSQAQGSWQNAKGSQVEVVIKGLLQRRLREKKLISQEVAGGTRLELLGNRTVIFADEPDVAFYKHNQITAAVEIKGGIDTAGVLERIGAAMKSLSRVKKENPQAVTILLLQGVSVTQQAKRDLETNKKTVNHWFAVEDLLENEERRSQFFQLLGV
jgi:hypothetical protein